jgi:hypothetical protein
MAFMSSHESNKMPDEPHDREYTSPHSELNNIHKLLTNHQYLYLNHQHQHQTQQQHTIKQESNPFNLHPIKPISSKAQPFILYLLDTKRPARIRDNNLCTV